METKSCIYCGRTLDVDRLLERGGAYRCKDENDCLEYQAGEDPVDSTDNTDYISDLIKSLLAEAAERIATYRGTGDQAKSSAGDPALISQESIDEFAWMKSAVEALALEYKGNQKFVFQYDETRNNEYKILFNDADHRFHITVKIDPRDGSSYSLSAADGEIADNAEPLYREFIYKSYPADQREDLLRDLAVMVIVLEGEKDRIPVLLNDFRTDIESRCHHHDA